ncbi:MAG: hypothetical protein EPN72_00510 [Nevskiaceae bacterium]|nr:MAG: hypothetical protein EPN63_09695 [Nevskiaceae bacterium]TBR75147.1 MAG: hypothetical protein EPN72_00510 [Nevskiaceae bacterium]
MSHLPVFAVDGATLRLANLALDAYAQRHRVISENIANIHADDFQPLSLNFEQQLGALRRAVKDGVPDTVIDRLVGQVHPYAVETQSAAQPSRPSERLDDQMTALVFNTLNYESMLTAVGRMESIYRLAITGS